MNIQLYASYDDIPGWIISQEMYCDFDDFAGWFDRYSKSWKTLFNQADVDAGFFIEGGNTDGYRNVVKKMIRTWEKETNVTLKETFDGFVESEEKREKASWETEQGGVYREARVRIFTEGDDENSSEDESDDDEDDEEDEEEDEAEEEEDEAEEDSED